MAIMRRWCLLVACCAVSSAVGATAPDAPIVAAPSAHAGAKELYVVQSTIPGCAYSVNAKAYDPSRPAGLHLFFGAEGAKDVDDTWAPFEEPALKPLNLIGVNMAFKDGDYNRDISGKVRAARLAAAQVIADYKIAPGRGILACYSAGGIAASAWLAQGKEPGPAFPFCHIAVYSADVSAPPADAGQLSWYIGLGTQEWRHGSSPLSARLRDVSQQLLQLAVKKGGCGEVFVAVTGKGHNIVKDEVALSSELYARSEVALAPFIAPGEFAASAQKFVDGANAHAYGATLTALDKAIDAPKTAESDRVRLTDIRGRIAGRIALELDLVERLSDSDPWLAAWYARLGQQQLGKHDQAKEFAAKLASLVKTDAFAKAVKGEDAFAQVFRSLFQSDPVLTPSAKDVVASLAANMPERSLVARMARDFCAMPAK